MDGNTFWLGLDLDENIANISGLSFYFDLYAVYNKEEYLNLLSYTAWSIGKDRLVMNKGISSQKEMPEDMALRLFSRYSLTNKINQSVTDRYNDHFLTIAEDCPVSDKKEYFPAELAPDFSENIKEKTGKPLIWIKITCPHRISPDIIDSLLLSINAFPVLNKEFISKITEVNKAIPIIPVNTECNQSFLSVHNINDSSGTKYYDVPVNGGTAHGFGVYAMRRGGIERYRKQDGDEYLTKITDSLRNKVSSFFKNRNDVKGDLRKIEYQVIRLINNLKRQQFQSREWSEVVNYLLIDPPKENDIYFTDYWVTNGNDANNIKAGSMFACISGLPVHPASVYSLSATKGGAYAPLGERKQNLYKNSLAQHDLLVTNEDIADFCLREFKESINKVEVSRGFMKSSDPKPGFVETTDVYLTPVKNMEEFVREKDREYFHRSLKEHSPATFNYRVFIKNALSTQETISI
jgi:hypothetical protein